MMINPSSHNSDRKTRSYEMKFVLTLTCLIGLICFVGVNAEPLIEGRVWLDSGEPVADAQVRLFDMSDLRPGSTARVTTDGTGYFALPLAVLTGRVLPQRFALGPNYPNPFNPYQLAISSEVRLEAFNLLGQRLATLVDGARPAGFHTATHIPCLMPPQRPVRRSRPHLLMQSRSGRAAPASTKSPSM